MVQVPRATVRTVDPDTVHTCGVLEVNDTGSPEVAVADKTTGSPTGTPPFTTSGGGVKETACGLFPVVTWKEFVTWEAAA
jgi:hypothetical protein